MLRVGTSRTSRTCLQDVINYIFVFTSDVNDVKLLRRIFGGLRHSLAVINFEPCSRIVVSGALLVQVCGNPCRSWYSSRSENQHYDCKQRTEAKGKQERPRDRQAGNIL